jgi:competence protein ComEC
LLAQWALAEVAPGRLVPWLEVAFGLGIVGYFTADREPTWWAAEGFAVATLQTLRIAHPVLQFTASAVTLSGFVEIREERERSDRIVVRIHKLTGARMAEIPERVRVAARKNTAPMVGSFAEMKAHLSPPLPPLRPAATTSPAICFSSASARPATHSVKSP